MLRKFLIPGLLTLLLITQAHSQESSYPALKIESSVLTIAFGQRFGIILIGLKEESDSKVVTVYPDKEVIEWRLPPKASLESVRWLGAEFIESKRAVGFGSGPSQARDPIRLASDSFDHVYLVDQAQEKITKLSRDLLYITEFGHFSMDTAGSFEDDFGNFDEGGFDGLKDVLAGDRLSLFVSDSRNHRIVELDLSGNFVREITPPDEFDEPTSLRRNSRNQLYVLDSEKERILIFNGFGTRQYELGGFGRDQYHFQRPVDIALNSSDELFVLDAGLKKLRKYSSKSRFINETDIEPGYSQLHVGPLGFLYALSDKSKVRCLTPNLVELQRCPLPEGVNTLRSLTHLSNKVLIGLGVQAPYLIQMTPKPSSHSYKIP